MSSIKRLIHFFALICIGLTGCTATDTRVTQPLENSRHIRTGEAIAVDYTCRAANGRVVDSTLQSVVDDPSIEKSSVYLQRDTYLPVLLVAGTPPPKNQNLLKPFYPELHGRLSQELVGKARNRDLSIQISSQISEGIDEANRYETTKTERVTPAEETVWVRHYIEANGSLPEVGQILEMDGKPFAKVTEITKEHVKYKYIFDKKIIHTIYGKAEMFNHGDKLVSRLIRPEEGSLVRRDAVVGKITKINNKTISIDYAYPLGDPGLSCEVRVIEPIPENTIQVQKPLLRKATN